RPLRGPRAPPAPGREMLPFLPPPAPAPAPPRPRARASRSPPSRRRDPGSASSRFGHHQIVAVNDLVAPTVTEDAGDFITLVPGNPADIGARIGREPTPGLDPGAISDDHRVAALEGPLDGDDPRRQQALAAAQRADR